MNRNKWIAGIMLVLLSFSLVACGHQAEETSGSSAEAAVSASSEVTSATSTEDGDTNGGDFVLTGKKWEWVEWDGDRDGTQDLISFEYNDNGDEAESYILVKLENDDPSEAFIDRARRIVRILDEEDEEGPYLKVEYNYENRMTENGDMECVVRIRDGAIVVEETEDAAAAEEGAEASAEPISEVNVSCQYTAADTHGANQFAVWVENEAGEMVRTVFVTDFTAGRRGYREREMSLSAWVASADPENMSDEVIDAISSATPGSGALTFSWDMCDAEGNRVPDGQYTLKFESNFYMESDVLYTALIDTTATPAGTVELQEVRSMPDDPTNENMITEVSVEVVR